MPSSDSSIPAGSAASLHLTITCYSVVDYSGFLPAAHDVHIVLESIGFRNIPTVSSALSKLPLSALPKHTSARRTDLRLARRLLSSRYWCWLCLDICHTPEGRVGVLSRISTPQSLPPVRRRPRTPAGTSGPTQQIFRSLFRAGSVPCSFRFL